MPELTWIGKDKVVNHHHDVPFRILEKQYSFGEENSGNKIIHGDNLAALKSLLPEYEGRVKCIYIDPPYNTGNEGWVYNDNVNDPKLKKWLNQVVGKEGEDLSRHDKWLCMMYPRLKLLRRLLSDDGVISYQSTTWRGNIERSGFKINGFLNHFPDFFVFMNSGRILIIETKGDYLDNSDSEAKVRLGLKWAGEAGKNFQYLMIFETRVVPDAFNLQEAIHRISHL